MPKQKKVVRPKAQKVTLKDVTDAIAEVKKEHDKMREQLLVHEARMEAFSDELKIMMAELSAANQRRDKRLDRMDRHLGFPMNI